MTATAMESMQVAPSMLEANSPGKKGDHSDRLSDYFTCSIASTASEESCNSSSASISDDEVENDAHAHTAEVMQSAPKNYSREELMELIIYNSIGEDKEEMIADFSVSHRLPEITQHSSSHYTQEQLMELVIYNSIGKDDVGMIHELPSGGLHELPAAVTQDSSNTYTHEQLMELIIYNDIAKDEIDTTSDLSNKVSTESSAAMAQEDPNQHSRERLLKLAYDVGFEGRYNLLYLPADFNHMAGLISFVLAGSYASWSSVWSQRHTK